MASAAEKPPPPRVAGGEQNLMVALRVRPMSDDEIIQGSSPIAHRVDEKMVVLLDPMEDPDDILRANRSREKSFVFDVTFDGSCDQQEVYNSTTRILIQNVISGYNATVFAYGATGAGKTYTMLGTDANPGIMVRALNDLFLEMEKTKEDMAYRVTMSYLEIYNEMIRDLLSPSSGYLELREDSKGVQVAGLSEVSAKSTSEVMGMLIKGNKERTQEPTAANKTSSRSHAVLQVVVKQRSRVRNVIQEIRTGKLFLIDLAGSERAANTHNRGKRMVEGAHINRSLLALGNCINALSDKIAHKYINYRDSKLTRLLKDALGGNCKTVMIAHISPASIHFEESRNTLVYADRAKQIKTKVRRNVMDASYHIAQYTQIIGDLREEISRLRQKLDQQAQQNKANIQSVQERIADSARHNDTEVQQETRKEELTAINRFKELLLTSFKDQMELRRSLMELNNTLMEIDLETNRHQLLLNQYEGEKTRNKMLEDDNRSRENEKALELSGSVSSPEEPEEIKAARDEIRTLMIEKSRTDQLRINVLQELDDAKNKSGRIEELLPVRVSNEEQKEVLSLMCRVHELEIENMEMQSTCLMRDHLIRVKEIKLAKFENQRNLYDEIIQQQRALITNNQLDYPKELEELYDIYDQANLESLTSNESPDEFNSVEPYKTTSISNMTRKLLNAERAWESGRLGPLQEESSTRHNRSHGDLHTNQDRHVPPKSSYSMPTNDIQPVDKIFSRSPKAKILQQSLFEGDDSKLLNATLPKQMVRQPSIITLSSRSAHSTPTPPNIHQKIPGTSLDPLAPMRDDPRVIASNTRNIAALAAAKRKNKAYTDAVNLERMSLLDSQFNKTYTSLRQSQGKNSEFEAFPDNNSQNALLLPQQQKKTEVYLSPNTLAKHNMKYINTNHDPTRTFLTEDVYSDITADQHIFTHRSEVSHNYSNIPQNTSRTRPTNKANVIRDHPTDRRNAQKTTQDRSKPKPADYKTNYQQMSPEQFFKQLSKATVRKTDSKPKGRGAPRRGPGAPPGGTTGRGRGSLQPRNVGQRAAAVYTPRSNQRYYADANNNLTQPQKSKKEQTYDYNGRPREFEPAEPVTSTIHQTAPDRGRGMTLQRKVKVPANPSSESSLASTPMNAEVKPRVTKRLPPPTIPNYRKGSMSVTGFGLK